MLICRLLLAVLGTVLFCSVQAGTITWTFDLGPDLPSPGPNSLSDGQMEVVVATMPDLVIDRAADRGWYLSQRSVTEAHVILDGVEWVVVGGSVTQEQCWDTEVFANPGCGGLDMDRFTLWLDFETGGHLALGYLASPEPGLPYAPGYPIWLGRPLQELTHPIMLRDLEAQGLRDPSAPDRAAFQFAVESWRLVPEPATLALLGFGLAGLGWSHRRMA